MVNTPKKKKDSSGQKRLFAIAEAALKDQGWRLERPTDSRKPSERLMTKRGHTLRATIRTSQDEWLAFPLKDAKGTKFGPLATADRVVVATLDPEDSNYALVFDFPAEDVRERFKKAFDARKRAGLAVVRMQHGMWVSLFRHDGQHPVYYIGGGIALEYKPIARVSLVDEARAVDDGESTAASLSDVVAAAKRRIAAAAGVTPEQVRISIEA